MLRLHFRARAVGPRSGSHPLRVCFLLFTAHNRRAKLRMYLQLLGPLAGQHISLVLCFPCGGSVIYWMRPRFWRCKVAWRSSCSSLISVALPTSVLWSQTRTTNVISLALWPATKMKTSANYSHYHAARSTVQSEGLTPWTI